MIENPYEQWLSERREVPPPLALADQIMSQIADLDRQPRDVGWFRLVHRIERSRAVRWGVCGGALVIGGLPFVFLAHVAQFLPY